MGYYCAPLSETMPRPSADHRSELLVARNVSSTNLGVQLIEEMKRLANTTLGTLAQILAHLEESQRDPMIGTVY
jgi:hypothetical protein